MTVAAGFPQNILQPLIDVAEAILLFFYEDVGFGWGLSIIALTFVVRALIFPLTLKQMKSMQSLARLQPQIKELQAKYKDDKQRLNQEMMKFYRENKVNPLGSCLPLLLQLPVFLALFYLLQDELKGQIKESGKPGFLFIPDLTEPATGAVLVALIALYIGTQLAASLLMSTSADKNQRRIMLALPLIFVIFIIQFPAGLVVYWIATNVWTIGQSLIVKRLVGPIRPPTLDTGKDGGGGFLGGLLGGGGGTPAKDGGSAKGGGGNGAAAAGASNGAGGASKGARLTKDGKGGDGKAADGKGTKTKTPAKAKAAARSGPPPQAPRKRKKKRSGRRR